LHDVEAAIALAPTHVSHYQLTLEAGTVFAAEPPPDLPSDDASEQILAACGERLAAAGFAQYEVSGYAQPGRQCRHNLNYWTFGDYLGVGAGAHGKLTFGPGTIVRTVQAREPRRYLAAVPAALTRNNVPAADLPFEFMLNALRLVDGFEIKTFVERTGIQWDEIAPKVDALMNRKLLIVQGTRLFPTVRGLRFLNDMLLSFLAETPQTTGAFGLSTAV
jgi:coproporphyrinogen III oxidase-like Fe-S oxidoreductase